MPTMVDFPTVVQDALVVFGDLCDTEPARRHVAESLTGLLVAENTTVSGINRAYVLTTDPSCLHLWLTEGHGDVKTLHDQRLAWLQQAPQTRYSVRGGMAIDHTLVHHEGTLLEDGGWCWDHADQRHVIAHDAMLSHSGYPARAHSPSEWRRFQTRDAWAEGAGKDHTTLCRELMDDALTRAMPGDCTCDSSCTSATILNHIQSKQRASGGDLQLNRKVVEADRAQTLQEVAQPIPWEAKQPVRMGSTRYWYCSTQRRLPDVTHPVRIVLFWRERGDQEASTALVRNRLGWEVLRMGVVYRDRWTGTETLHRAGKQPLGRGDCQVRSGEGPTRHGYLVSAAYRRLLRSLHATRPQDGARKTLTTLGEACRAVKAETLGRLGDWILDRLSIDHWSVSDMKAVLTNT